MSATPKTPKTQEILFVNAKERVFKVTATFVDVELPDEDTGEKDILLRMEVL